MSQEVEKGHEEQKKEPILAETGDPLGKSALLVGFFSWPFTSSQLRAHSVK